MILATLIFQAIVRCVAVAADGRDESLLRHYSPVYLARTLIKH